MERGEGRGGKRRGGEGWVEKGECLGGVGKDKRIEGTGVEGTTYCKVIVVVVEEKNRRDCEECET